MKPAPFRYHAPKTVEEALQTLAAVAGEDGRVLAGGQSLVPIMAFRLARPAHLVDINGVETLHRLAVDGDIDPVFTYRVGVRLRWWLGDLDWLLIRLRERGSRAQRLQALQQFLRPAGRATRTEILRRDDPAPAIRELSQYLQALLRGAVARLGRRRASHA